MPKSIVTTETSAIRGSVGLHTQAPSEIAHTTGRFRCVPLATILSNDVVEESAEDVLSPACVGIIGVVGGAKVEGLAFTCRDALKGGAEADCTRVLVTRKVNQEGDCRLRENGSC